jgi:hypothetical protein
VKALAFDNTTGGINGPAFVSTNVTATFVPPPAWYLDTPATIHVANPPEHLLPPNPCDGLAHAWDNAVIRSNGGKNPTSSFIVLLALGAAHQCVFAGDTVVDASGNTSFVTLALTGDNTL